MTSVRDAITAARSTLRANPGITEAQARQAVIDPVLESLGWDRQNLSEWLPEMKLDGIGNVDYALRSTSKPGEPRPMVFIEAKRPGSLSAAGQKQLFEYATNRGVPLLVLTDGDIWDFYYSPGTGLPEDRKFLSLRITADGIDETADELSTYLSRDRVVRDDAAAEAAYQRLREIQGHSIARAQLADAWAHLLSDPDSIVHDALSEETERISGYRPSADDLSEFLADAAQPAPAVQRRTRKARTKPARAVSVGKTPATRLTSASVGGTLITADSGRQVAAKAAGAVEDARPGTLERFEGNQVLRQTELRKLPAENQKFYKEIERHEGWYLRVQASTAGLCKTVRALASSAGVDVDLHVTGAGGSPNRPPTS